MNITNAVFYQDRHVVSRYISDTMIGALQNNTNFYLFQVFEIFFVTFICVIQFVFALYVLLQLLFVSV